MMVQSKANQREVEANRQRRVKVAYQERDDMATTGQTFRQLAECLRNLKLLRLEGPLFSDLARQGFNERAYERVLKELVTSTGRRSGTFPESSLAAAGGQERALAPLLRRMSVDSRVADFNLYTIESAHGWGKACR